jgi:hypothetical protein
VRGADEAGFVQRRRQVHAAVQHAVEEAVEALLVGGHHRAVVLRQRVGEEEAEHAAFAVATSGTPAARGGLPGRRPAARVRAASASKKPGLLISFSVARPQAVATGLPLSVPAW